MAGLGAGGDRRPTAGAAKDVDATFMGDAAKAVASGPSDDRRSAGGQPSEGARTGAGRRQAGARQPQTSPIRIPAASTSAPPTTTWNTARRNGVLIHRFWIQAIAQSSAKTSARAIAVAVMKSGIR